MSQKKNIIYQDFPWETTKIFFNFLRLGETTKEEVSIQKFKNAAERVSFLLVANATQLPSIRPLCRSVFKTWNKLSPRNKHVAIPGSSSRWLCAVREEIQMPTHFVQPPTLVLKARGWMRVTLRRLEPKLMASKVVCCSQRMLDQSPGERKRWCAKSYLLLQRNNELGLTTHTCA